ncbi:MAG: glycogen debranching N-terminal domain-containing protein, partial [Geodermatophilaceae bacterium]
HRLEPLSVQDGDPYAAAFICRVPPGAGHADSAVLIIRHRYVGNGMREDIAVRNTSALPVTCTVFLHFAADFADLFEVKDRRDQPAGGVAARVHDGTVLLARRRGAHEHSVLLRADGDPALHPDHLSWSLRLAARGEWLAVIEVAPMEDGVAIRLRHPRDVAVEHSAPALQLRAWRARSPRIRTADPNLAAVLRQSVEDLGALRIYDPGHPQRAAVAAGAPWFMALFGRDSLLTSWMLLPLDASLAIGTLQTLAERQGRSMEAESEEEPGRILHETRFGPATELALGGRGIYYGTVDATPLFVMLLGELHRWGYAEQTRSLLEPADRALAWIEDHGDRDGDGFVEYERKTDRGLANQGWKDSWDGVNFADGQIAEAPIALAEAQGYCYAAFAARAQIAVTVGDEDGARHWAEKARRLKRNFNERFWLPERGWFAVGLDCDKRPIDALTSNIGHCLWTGIVDDDKAASVAGHLMSDDMFTGWGIRTLAASMAAFNPMSYHNGSVWPHDSALCAAGLMRYGFVEQAQRVAGGVLDAAEHFGHRLPELFCGFARDEFHQPVPYPSSCSPQAWAAAAPVLLLRSLLRLDPQVPDRQLWCSPTFPPRYLPLHLDGLRVGHSEITVDVRDRDWQLSGLDGSGLDLLRTPRPVGGG